MTDAEEYDDRHPLLLAPQHRPSGSKTASNDDHIVALFDEEEEEDDDQTLSPRKSRRRPRAISNIFQRHKRSVSAPNRSKAEAARARLKSPRKEKSTMVMLDSESASASTSTSPRLYVGDIDESQGGTGGERKKKKEKMKKKEKKEKKIKPKKSKKKQHSKTPSMGDEATSAMSEEDDDATQQRMRRLPRRQTARRNIHDAESAPHTAGPERRIQNELNGVQNAMRSNLDGMLVRGEKLEDLEETMNKMALVSFELRHGAGSLHRVMWRRRCFRRVLVVLIPIIIAFVLLLILYITLCGWTFDVASCLAPPPPSPSPSPSPQ